MRRLSAIEFRLFLVLLGLVIASIVGGVLYYRSHRANLRRAAMEELDSVAELKASQIDRWRDKRLDTARLLHAAPHMLAPFASVLSGSPSKAEAEAALRLADLLCLIEPLRRLLVMDTQLRPVLASSGNDLSFDGFFAKTAAQALRSGSVLMTDLYRCKTHGTPTMGVVLPIPDPNRPNVHLGVAMLEIDPSVYLYPYIGTWPSASASAESLLVRREGDSVLFLNDVRHRPGSALSLRLKIDENPKLAAVHALSVRKGAYESVDYRGTPVLAATRAVPDSTWFVVAKRDLEEIDRPMRRQAVMIGLFITGIVVCGTLAIVVIWRTREFQHAKEELRRREEAAEALRQSDHRYRLLFSEMTLGFALHELIVDERGVPADYRFLEINPAFERLTGMSAEMAVGKRVLELIPNLERIWIERYGRVAQTGEPISFEAYNAPLDRHFEVRAYSPEPGRFAVLFQDVTARVRMQQERERLNAELLRKNEEMESLIYAASHDLRSPLVNIEGFSHRIEKHCATIEAAFNRPDLPEELRTSLADITQRQLPTAIFYIRGGVKKMNTLIAGLLQISRAGKSQLHPAQLDVNAIASEVAASHAFQIQKEAAGFRIEPLPSCWADAIQLNQVFSNLLDNALKYRSPDRPLEIRISGRSENGQSFYCFEDNGIGIKPEHRDRIWEIFHRLAPDGPVKGEGLGLSLVRRIVSRMGGSAWVESAENHGSRFFVSLPAAPSSLPHNAS